MTIICGEDGWWLHEGERLRGSEPEAPLRLNLAELTPLTSGFGIRDDLEQRLMILRELAEYHGCDVASIPDLGRPLEGLSASPRT